MGSIPLQIRILIVERGRHHQPQRVYRVLQEKHTGVSLGQEPPNPLCVGQERRKGCPEMIPPEATTGGPPTPTILWSRERKSTCQGLKGDMGWSWSQAISHKKQSEAPPVRGTERNQGGWRARGLLTHRLI